MNTWHLFKVEATDADGQHDYIVSAESESEDKARELAEGAVYEHLGDEDDSGAIDSIERIGSVDSDIFLHFGPR